MAFKTRLTIKNYKRIIGGYYPSYSSGEAIVWRLKDVEEFQDSYAFTFERYNGRIVFPLYLERTPIEINEDGKPVYSFPTTMKIKFTADQFTRQKAVEILEQLMLMK